METSSANQETVTPPDLSTSELRERISSLSFENLVVTIPTYKTQHAANNEKFTTYSLHIETIDGDDWTVFRRYSQFLKLHNSLPDDVRKAIPMPPKKYRDYLNDRFVLKRKEDLEKYIQNLLVQQKNILIGTDVGSFLGCDLNKKRGSTKPNGLSNSRKKMTEFNWVHRTGGMAGGMRGNHGSANPGFSEGTEQSNGNNNGSGNGGKGCVLL